MLLCAGGVGGVLVWSSSWCLPRLQKFKAPQGPAPVFKRGFTGPDKPRVFSPPESRGRPGLHGTQVFSKSTSLGTGLATCTFQREVCLEAGGHARTGHLRPQMATWGNSDGHAGQLSRGGPSLTRLGSRRRKPGFSARDFLGNLPRACAHAPMLMYVTRTVSPLWVGSGSRSDSATPRLRT